jgi:hypothetical protein
MHDTPDTSRRLGRMAFLALLMLGFCVAGRAQAAIGDQVELKATHQAGVPFHTAPGGSRTFQRVPDGTIGTVTDTARDGRGLQLRLRTSAPAGSCPATSGVRSPAPRPR